MEQVQYNMLFRWFVGLFMDDTVWVPTVFRKNRGCLTEHDAIVAYFNMVVTMADKKGCYQSNTSGWMACSLEASPATKVCCARQTLFTTTAVVATSRDEPAAMPAQESRTDPDTHCIVNARSAASHALWNIR